MSIYLHIKFRLFLCIPDLPLRIHNQTFQEGLFCPFILHGFQNFVQRLALVKLDTVRGLFHFLCLLDHRLLHFLCRSCHWLVLVLLLLLLLLLLLVALVQRFLVLLVLADARRVILVTHAIFKRLGAIYACIVRVRTSIIMLFGILLGHSIIAHLTVERNHPVITNIS